jgi:putative transcriptional regulator
VSIILDILSGLCYSSIKPKAVGNNDLERRGWQFVAKNLKLKSARAALDLTQKDLAEAVGVSRQTMNAIEKGDYYPSVKLCIEICKVLGKTLDELFWEDDMHENKEAR